MKTEIHTVLGTAGLGAMQGDINTLKDGLDDLKAEWTGLKGDVLPTYRDSTVEGVSALVRLIFDEMVATPDDIRRQRKKLEETVEGLKDSLAKLVSESTEALQQVFENKRKSALEVFQTDITGIIEKVLSESSANKITEEVVSVIKGNLNKDIASRVQFDLKASVASIHKVLMHDLKGALDGEVKKALTDMVQKTLDSATEQSRETTKNFFDTSLQEFVTHIINSVSAAFRVSPQPPDPQQQPGNYFQLNCIQYSSN